MIAIDFKLVPSCEASESEFLVNLSPILRWSQMNPGRAELTFSIVELSSDGTRLQTSCPYTQVVFNRIRCMFSWGSAYFFIALIRLFHPDGSSSPPKKFLCLVDSESGRSRAWLMNS